jgi:hypothetical protein
VRVPMYRLWPTRRKIPDRVALVRAEWQPAIDQKCRRGRMAVGAVHSRSLSRGVRMTCCVCKKNQRHGELMLCADCLSKFSKDPASLKTAPPPERKQPENHDDQQSHNQSIKHQPRPLSIKLRAASLHVVRATVPQTSIFSGRSVVKWF